MKTTNLRTVPLSDLLKLPVHPVADLFPLLPNEARKEDGRVESFSLPELAASIAANGLREPIVLFAEEILDGRNRRAACVLVAEGLGADAENYEVPVKDFVGTEEEANEYVLDLNVDRRDLTPGQRAFVAIGYWDYESKKAKVRQLGGLKQNQGAIQETFPEAQGQARDFLAQRFHVNAHYITDALRIMEQIKDGQRQAELASQEAEKQLAIVRQKTAELQAAHAAQEAVADRVARAALKTKAEEASREANRARNAANELTEKAVEKSTKAAATAIRAAKVRAGKATMNSLVKAPKPEISDTEPVVKFRNKINSAMANFKQAISELSAVSAKGEDDYNFVGQKITDLIDHFEAVFGVSMDEIEMA